MDMLMELMDKGYEVTFRPNVNVIDKKKEFLIVLQRSKRIEIRPVLFTTCTDDSFTLAINHMLRDIYKVWRENHLGLEDQDKD